MSPARRLFRFDREFAVRFVLRDGKLVTVQAFTEWRQGLESVGLSD